MKNSVYKFLLTLILAFNTAEARELDKIEILLPEMADKVGNGGDVVVCRDSSSQITSVELLDIYEGRTERGIIPNMKPGLSLQKNINIILQRLSFFDTYMRDQINENIKKFKSESRFLTGTNLIDIKDSDHISVPAGCSVEQIVVQKEPKFAEDKFYTINKDLWDLLDTTNQAALILHEVIYRNVILKNRSSNSISTRYFVSLVVSNDILNLTYEEYLNFILTELGFVKTNISGNLVDITSVIFSENAKLKSYIIGFDKNEDFEIESQFIKLNKNSSVKFEFFENETLKTILIKNIGTPGIITIQGQSINYSEYLIISYDQSGKVAKISSNEAMDIISFYNKDKKGEIKCKEVIFNRDLTLNCSLENYPNQIDLRWVKNNIPNIMLSSRIGNEIKSNLKLSKNLIPMDLEIKIEYKDKTLDEKHNFTFYNTGAIKKIESVNGKIYFSYENINHLIELNSNGIVEFYENGVVKSGGYKSKDVKVLQPSGISGTTLTSTVTSNYGKDLCSGYNSEYTAYENNTPTFLIRRNRDGILNLELTSGEKTYVTSKDIVLLTQDGKPYEVLRDKCVESF